MHILAAVLNWLCDLEPIKLRFLICKMGIIMRLNNMWKFRYKCNDRTVPSHGCQHLLNTWYYLQERVSFHTEVFIGEIVWCQVLVFNFEKTTTTKKKLKNWNSEKLEETALTKCWWMKLSNSYVWIHYVIFYFVFEKITVIKKFFFFKCIF